MSLTSLVETQKEEIEEVVSSEPEIVKSDNIPAYVSLEANKWARIDGVSVAFVDLVNSTQIDFDSQPKMSARIYEAFTGTLVRVMDQFGAAYIDVKGDGVFAIFDGKHSPVKAFLAAETFRTICEWHIRPKIYSKTNGRVVIQCRAGISYGTTIVKRIGLRREKNNEVWAYKTVNESSKVSRLASPGQLVVSAKVYEAITVSEKIKISCGCDGNGNPSLLGKTNLWEAVDLFSDSGYLLKSLWCKIHGDEYLDSIIEEFELELPKLNSSKAA